MIRHAEPKVSGDSRARVEDPGLSERGHVQAGRVADWLLREKLDRIISSPAARARATASRAADRAGLDVQIDERLRDTRAEGDEYVPIEVDRAGNPAAYAERIQHYRATPTLSAIAPRVLTALGEWTARCAGERIAVFCHGSVVNVYAADVLGLPEAAFLEADYASGHRFRVSRTGIRSVASLNETAFLTD